MKKHLLPLLLTAVMTAFTPSLQAKDKPVSAEVADKAAPEEKEESKNLSKEEHAKLKAAREKAEKDPAVVTAAENEKAAKKAFIDASKSGDKAKAATAKQTLDDAHDATVKARHDAIAKADPEAGKLDDRAFAVGERLRKAKDAKAKEREGKEAVDDEGSKARGKGKGLEHAPGRLKKEKGGEATDYAPGQQKDTKGKKGESDE